MSTRTHDEPLDLLQGTLDLLILRTLILAPQHGHAIALAIKHSSDHELLVEHGETVGGPAADDVERTLSYSAARVRRQLRAAQSAEIRRTWVSGAVRNINPCNENGDFSQDSLTVVWTDR